MEPTKGHGSNGSKWNCVVYTCPNCNVAISVDVDGTAIRADILETIADLRRRLGV